MWLKSSLRLGQAKVQPTQIVQKFLESWLQLDSSLNQQDLLISTDQTKILADRDYKFNFLVLLLFFKPFDPNLCNLQIKYKNNSRARFPRLLGPFGNVVLVMLFKFFENTYGWKSVVQICVMLFKQRKLFCTQVLGIFQLS